MRIMKVKKASIILTIIFLLNIGIAAFAQDTVSYSENDINMLKSILHESENNEALLDWDLNIPNSIEQAEWNNINGTYYIASLDFSDIQINGNIDLTDFGNLQNCCFSGTDINSIQLPCSLRCIPDNAFKNCTNLKAVTVNAQNTEIGSNAFSGCVSLTAFVNAEKIISIGRNAFNNCSNAAFYYSANSVNEYSRNYASENGFSIINSTSAVVSGYSGISYSPDITCYDLNSKRLPYSAGNVSIYTSDKQLISTVEIDETGKFILENLTVGKKYRIVIDGQTALPREKYFVPLQSEYCIAPITNCLGVIVCDYNRDGIVNTNDVNDFLLGYNKAFGQDYDYSIYDFNCDGYCNSMDLSTFLYFINYDYQNFKYEQEGTF